MGCVKNAETAPVGPREPLRGKDGITTFELWRCVYRAPPP
jgi:hypothetical protein